MKLQEPKAIFGWIISYVQDSKCTVTKAKKIM
jgi:hypothetical protein